MLCIKGSNWNWKVKEMEKMVSGWVGWDDILGRMGFHFFFVYNNNNNRINW
jgi:hypothetical protein